MFKQLFQPKRKTEKRASLENPSTSLANPDAWLWEAFGTSQEGVNVNYKSSLGIPAWYAATGRRARTIGSLSCKVFLQTDKGLEPDYDHPLFNLLNRQPHPLYNSYTFFQTMVTNLDSRGVAYAQIQRNGDGNPIALEIIEPDHVNSLQVTESGNYFFLVEKKDARGIWRTRAIALSDMIWVKGMSFNGYDCMDPIGVHKETFGSALAANEYAKKFYENGAHINYAVESPASLSPTAKDNFYDAWRRVFSGIKNAFRRPLIVDAGMKLHPLKMTPIEAEMTTSKKQTVEEMARIADIPPHMVGAGENYTFSSVEVMVTDFVQYSLRNTIKQLEMEIENKLFTDREKDERSHRIKFNLDSLLQGDIKTRTEKLIQEVQWGLIDKNEYRRMQGYNEVENGDVVFNPVNMFVTKTGEEPVNPIQNDNNDD